MYPSAALSLPVNRHLPRSFPADGRPRSRSPRHCQVATFGWDCSGGGGGSFVDENMVVLRKRIHETKMAETDHDAPAEWMDWAEKRYYAIDLPCTPTSARSCVPAADRTDEHEAELAIGLLAALALSVCRSTSAVLISIHLVDAFKSMINVAGAMHLGRIDPIIECFPF